MQGIRGLGFVAAEGSVEILDQVIWVLDTLRYGGRCGGLEEWTSKQSRETEEWRRQINFSIYMYICIYTHIYM
jgi:hypothetical protein